MDNLQEKIARQVAKAIRAPPRSEIEFLQEKELEELELEKFRNELVQAAEDNPPAQQVRFEETDEEPDEESDGETPSEHSSEEGEELPPLSEIKAIEAPPEPFEPDTFCRDLKNPEGKTFRFQAQRGMFTYKTHLNKDEFRAWLPEVARRTLARIEIAHETSDKSHPYEHTHVVVDFGSTFDSKNCRIFDYKGIHPNIKVIGSKAHWNNALVYLAKQDPQNGHLAKAAEKPPIADSVWKATTRQEAARMAKTPGEVVGILQLFDIKPQERKNPLAGHALRYWQVVLLNQLETPADSRKIVWIYDLWGACGKTILLKYLLSVMPTDIAFAKQTGGAKDFATVIQSARDCGWNGKAFILDFVRDMEDHKFYEPLEGLKDGLVTALKYRGQSMAFDSPHVVVFANFLPDVDKLSLDRWMIYEIIHNYRDMPLGPPPQPDGTASCDIAALNINIVRRKRAELRGEAFNPYAVPATRVPAPGPDTTGSLGDKTQGQK